MNWYEQSYSTDWDALSVDEAVTRAYALGVAASLDEYETDELEAIRGETESAYERSVVDLAFEEGKNEGREQDLKGHEDEEVWRSLVDGDAGRTEADSETDSTTLPEAVDRIEALEQPTPGENSAIELPPFLERD
jgi:hypothetical protein